MYVTLVHVHVKSEYVDQFIQATSLNHKKSILEPGNTRFDVLQMSNDPTRFILYEAYRSVEDAARHKDTEHYLQWRQTVADWMASPREGVQYNGLYPQGGE